MTAVNKYLIHLIEIRNHAQMTKNKQDYECLAWAVTQLERVFNIKGE
ncbi:hypothetical protein [Megasphaera sueciensis]